MLERVEVDDERRRLDGGERIADAGGDALHQQALQPFHARSPSRRPGGNVNTWIQWRRMNAGIHSEVTAAVATGTSRILPGTRCPGVLLPRTRRTAPNWSAASADGLCT